MTRRPDLIGPAYFVLAAIIGAVALIGLVVWAATPV
jgi:hypothetical protein